MMNIGFPLTKIEFWPLKIRQAVWAGIFLFVLLVGYVFFIKNEFIDLEKSSANQVELKKQIVEQYSQLKNIHLYAAEAEHLTNVLNTPFPRLLAKSDALVLGNAILREANSAGVTINAFNRLPMIQKEFYTEESIKINLSGSYYNIALFCNALILLKIVIPITDLHIMLNSTVSNVAENPDLIADLTIHLYYPDFIEKGKA
jgi:Tfp pilus assembly protein PilO